MARGHVSPGASSVGWSAAGRAAPATTTRTGSDPMKAITPYLNFDGTCREAMTFYQKAIGGELFLTTFGDAAFESPPESKDRVIHARLANGEAVVMASDTMPGTPYQQGNDVWLNIVCESDDEVGRLYGALVEGGREVMAPHDAFWGSRFAMLTDRFGINWMFNHERPRQSS
jgi:PhnB protein